MNLTLAIAIIGVFCGWASTAHAQQDSNTDSADASSAYHKLMSDGALQNFLGQCLAAERAFSRALEICLKRNKATRASCIDPMFRQANGLAVASTSPLHVSRYLTYRAMDLANRRKFKQAQRLVQAANARYKSLINKRLTKSRSGKDAKQKLNPILFELAHGLFVQATIAQRLGNQEAARNAMALANENAERVNGFPSNWRIRLENALQPTRPATQQTEAQTVGDETENLE